MSLRVPDLTTLGNSALFFSSLTGATTDQNRRRMPTRTTPTNPNPKERKNEQEPDP